MNDSLMTLANVDTAALMPSVIADDPDMAALLAAVDGFWHDIAASIPLLGVLATIPLQPEAVIDKLAYQFHVDYYDLTWPLAKKRLVVIDSIRLHKIAGTRGAVDDVIDSIWESGAIISEWWEHGGEPGTFELTLTNEITEANVESLLRSIRKVKRATDHMDITTVNVIEPAPVYAGVIYQEYIHNRL